jgi:two-component system response regulator HydG
MIKTPAHILIVDDNENLRKTMERVLKMKGYNVISAASGVDALEIAKIHQEIELVFMDIKMPLMNGVEAHKQLKEIIPDAIVIMMTAYAVDELIHQALENGAYGILHKPLELDGVLDIIERSMGSENGALVLIVDDDKSMRESFEKILVRKGFSVSVAKDGEEAIAIARNHPFDILFIDMKLPTINGLQTYLAIKEINPKTVAVLITGYPRDVGGLVDEAMKNSAYSCLHKPLDMVQVFSIVDEILARKREVS